MTRHSRASSRSSTRATKGVQAGRTAAGSSTANRIASPAGEGAGPFPPWLRFAIERASHLGEVLVLGDQDDDLDAALGRPDIPLHDLPLRPVDQKRVVLTHRSQVPRPEVYKQVGRRPATQTRPRKSSDAECDPDFGCCP